VSPLPVLIDFVIVQPDLPFLLLLFAFSIEKALSRVGFWMVCIIHGLNKFHDKATLVYLTKLYRQQSNQYSFAQKTLFYTEANAVNHKK